MNRTALSDRQLLFLYFSILIILGTVLLSLPLSHADREPIRLVDSLFTSVSAVCVTGLATIPTDQFSRIGQIILLILIQAGGLGFITFSTLFLFFPGARFSFSDSSIIQQYYGDEHLQNPRSIVRNIIGFTFALELAGIVLLYIGMKRQGVSTPVFSAVFHGISAFCNAGFSLYSDSLTRFRTNYWVMTGASFLIITGGLGFMVLWNLRKRIRYGRKVVLTYQTRLMLFLTPLLILAGFLFYFLQERSGLLESMSGKDAAAAALFQSITTRTAGFNSIEQGDLSLPSLIFTLFLMLTGGGSGSTAGGLKVTTMFLLFLVMIKGVDDHGEVTFLRRRIGREQLNRAALYFMKAIMFLFLSILLVALTEQLSWGRSFSLMEIVFECVSALGTVGLSMGITSELHIMSKLVLICTMFAGRIGLFAMIMPVYRAEVLKHVRYPSGEVLIG